jgi:hypothetical protein
MLRSTLSLSSRTVTKNCTNLLPTVQTVQTRNVRAVLSNSNEEAHTNVLHLYRKTIKMLPWIKDVFHLPFEVIKMRHIVRKNFDKNGHVKNRGVIDSLVTRALNDLEEVEMHHKQRGHVFHFFEKTEHTGRPVTLADSVLQSRDQQLAEEYGMTVDAAKTKALLERISSGATTTRRVQGKTVAERKRDAQREMQKRAQL